VLRKIRHICSSLFGLTLAVSSHAAPVTVVEYYNKPLDAYFITGRATEQTLLDSLMAFQRTGMTFQAEAATLDAPLLPASLVQVCRFYVNSQSPYANSHFYGLQKTDCERLLALGLPAFTWEGYDFALQQPVEGACPISTKAIYRSFRPAAGGKTANHRYSASASSYVASANSGYVAEQVAFCATAVTDVTVATEADCGTYFYPNVSIAYRGVAQDGAVDTWERFMAADTVIFNGRKAQPIIEQHASGMRDTLMIEDSAYAWSDLGSISENANGQLNSYYIQPTTFPRQMSVGEFVTINRYKTYSPIQAFGSPLQIGGLTLVGRELVSVPSGTYFACKFSGQSTSQYYGTGITELNRSTTWVAPGVGVVKFKTEETTYDDTGADLTITNEVSATSVRRN
jgi:hypothetical protein